MFKEKKNLKELGISNISLNPITHYNETRQSLKPRFLILRHIIFSPESNRKGKDRPPVNDMSQQEKVEAAALFLS